ncbi:hypothetical protein [Caenibacillus caldisaponilyticus]|uniref:hypothetical protein n=1 Tax=Caenibacillus caldisaponilyticus TaxID=1674942 RepID=UPI000988697A|nr:hypothetical protein [Caenibacillus caldisaponilyticus]
MYIHTITIENDRDGYAVVGWGDDIDFAKFPYDEEGAYQKARKFAAQKAKEFGCKFRIAAFGNSGWDYEFLYDGKNDIYKIYYDSMINLEGPKLKMIGTYEECHEWWNKKYNEVHSA